MAATASAASTDVNNGSPPLPVKKVYALELNADDILPPRSFGQTGEKLHLLMPYGPDECPKREVIMERTLFIYEELKKMIAKDDDFPKEEAANVYHYFKYCCYYPALHNYFKEGTNSEVQLDCLLSHTFYSIFYYVYDDLLDGGFVHETFVDQKHKYESIVQMNAVIGDVLSGKYKKMSDIPKDFTFPLKNLLLWSMLQMYKYAEKGIPNFTKVWPDFVRVTCLAVSTYGLTALEILDDSETNPCSIQPSYEARRSRRFYTSSAETLFVYVSIMNGQEVDHMNLEVESLMRAAVMQGASFNDLYSIKEDIQEIYSDNWIFAMRETFYPEHTKTDDMLPHIKQVVGYLNREMMEIHRLCHLISKRFPENQIFVDVVKFIIGASLFWHVDGMRHEKCSFKIKELKGYPGRDGQIKASDVIKDVTVSRKGM